MMKRPSEVILGIDGPHAVFDLLCQDESNSAPLALLDESLIKDLIYEIRGQKVMLDFDLARIYGYGTSAFNQR